MVAAADELASNEVTINKRLSFTVVSLRLSMLMALLR
jgi:hypothetical protein